MRSSWSSFQPFLKTVPALLLASLATSASGCNAWLEPLADTPENLELAIFTVSLRKNAGANYPVPSESAVKMIQGSSDFWKAKCGISFKHVGHFERNADEDGAPTSAVGNGDIRDLQYRYSHVNYISAVFTKEIEFDIQSDDSTVGGLAIYPWALDRRAILMVGPYEGIFSHELGHFMGLEHIKTNAYNLMFPADVVNHDKHVLEADQCAEAKRYLLSYSHLRNLCRPSARDPELSKTNCPKIDF